MMVVVVVVVVGGRSSWRLGQGRQGPRAIMVTFWWGDVISAVMKQPSQITQFQAEQFMELVRF